MPCNVWENIGWIFLNVGFFGQLGDIGKTLKENKGVG
jgi:hypothetical protein